MKKTTTYFAAILLLILISFAPPKQDESNYTSKYINYSITRNGGQAILTLDVKDIQQYDEIYLKRSTSPMENFRQVKYLNKSQISTLTTNSKIIDKYPLPGNVDAYYKVVAISKIGIYKSFPCVKLSKYN